MPSRQRIGILLILATMMMLFTAVPVSAASEPHPLDIAVDHAYYYDLDGDGVEDDVYIELTLKVPPGQLKPKKSDCYVTLTLPSGTYHLSLITIIGQFKEIHLGLSWYNTATEPGWYNVKVDVLTSGYTGRSYSTTTYDFDPPTGTGPGDPHIKVTVW